MPKHKTITAIDFGTDNCATLIATVNPDTDQLNIAGISMVPSRGIRKGSIVELERAVSTLSESLDGAERMAGFPVKSAYVSISGTHISSQNSRGVVAVAAPNQEISRSDIDRVIEAARAVSLPNDRTIIHVIPRDFKVDSQTGVKNPVGMMGIRLESEAHIITGMTTAIKNLEKCVGDVGLEVNSFVFSGLASAEMVASETEKELGVVVVDIGTGSTALSAYVEGSLEYSTALPIGARHLTQDIALGCRISLEAAEKVKVALSTELLQPLQPRPGESKDELAQRRKRADKLELSNLGINESINELSKKTLVEDILIPRLKEIFLMIGRDLQNKQLLTELPAGIIITGGGAETVGIVEVAKRTLRLPARIGQPADIPGLTPDVKKPAFATALGLLEFGRKYGRGEEVGSGFDLGGLASTLSLGGPGNKIRELLRSLLP